MKEDKKIFDNHVHTQFAYCSRDDMFPDKSITLAREKGCGICIVEHAGQLYVSNDDFWNGNIVNKPDLIHKEKTNRMDEYIKYIRRLRADDVRLGLELDVNKEGHVTLRDEHAGYFDMFLGAVHFILERFEDIDRAFMWNIDAFCDFGVDILAHPFRIYRKKNLGRPVHLYEKVAKTLARNGVAAEINFHTNEPDPDFFRACIENGVKLAFGSDAHCLQEVCSFERNHELIDMIFDGDVRDIMINY